MLPQIACYRFGWEYEQMREKRKKNDRGEKLLVECKKGQNDSLLCKDNLSLQRKGHTEESSVTPLGEEVC